MRLQILFLFAIVLSCPIPTAALPIVNPCVKTEDLPMPLQIIPSTIADRACSLRGLTHLQIYTQVDSGSDKELTNRINSLVVQKLEKAGIKTVVGTELISEMPHLLLMVKHSSDDLKNPFQLLVSAHLFQPVSLIRNTSVQFSVLTWQRETHKEKLDATHIYKTVATQRVLEAVDLFIADWWVANPPSVKQN